MWPLRVEGWVGDPLGGGTPGGWGSRGVGLVSVQSGEASVGFDMLPVDFVEQLAYRLSGRGKPVCGGEPQTREYREAGR